MIENTRLGAEKGKRAMAFLKEKRKGGPKDEGWGLTTGFGIKHQRFSFNFAFQPSGEIGNSYFVSLDSRF